MVAASRTENICLGCMNETGGAAPCPSCGWNQAGQPSSPIVLRPGSVLHGQYLVGRVLGHGGFGITYLGRDMNLGMKLAIKEFFPRDLVTREPATSRVMIYSGDGRDYFEYGLERFLDEARTLASFDDHPGIVSIVNYFRENETGYLVMKYLPGQTFMDFLNSQGGRVPFEIAVKVMTPVLDTLREVHRRGLLHRDVSPDNVYITTSNQVKLIDFGAARVALGERSRSLSVILKPGYAPREQYSSRGSQGPWTDIYAAGATMYRAITGTVPQDAPSRTERDELLPPSRLGFAVPRQAEGALMKSLAIKAADRFHEVGAFQAALNVPGEVVVRQEPKLQRCSACGTINVPHADHCANCGASLKLPAQAGDLKYAGFDRRIFAYFIDAVILGFVWLVAFAISMALIGALGARANDAFTGGIVLSSLLMSPAVWLYYSIMESSRYQGTPGKIIMHIAVTDLKGNKVSFFKAAGRNLCKGLSMLIAGVGFLMPVFSDKKQTLHDSLAGCLVLDKRQVPAQLK